MNNQPKRSHLEILKEIDDLLRINNFEKDREELEAEIEASATGSELCLRAGSKLLTLQNKNPNIKSVIGEQIKEFINYCHFNELFPKPVK